jgi:hypothetical protein
MRFTDSDRKAAFNLPLFLHGFLKVFRKKKDEPSFIEDQRLRLKKYDEKRFDLLPSAAMTSGTMKMDGIQETTTTTENDTAGKSAPAKSSNATTRATIPDAVKNTTAAPQVTAARNTTAASKSTAARNATATNKVTAAPHVTAVTKATADPVHPVNRPADRFISPSPMNKDRSRKPLSPFIRLKPFVPTPAPTTTVNRSYTAASATAGPGPTSMKFANLGYTRYPRISSNDLNDLQSMEEDDVRKFKDIENDGSTDSDDFVPRPPQKRVTGDGKGKMKERESSKQGKLDAYRDGEKLSSMNVIPRKRLDSALGIIRGRGKVEIMDNEESEEEDDEDIKQRPAKSMPRQDKKASAQNLPIPTGEYHDSKCSKCRISGRSCEIQKSGGACVNCRRYKHKCEYSRSRKEVKSRPVIESEDESASASSPPPPSRHPRMASAVARKAIKKAVIASEMGSKIQIKSSRSNGA